MTNRSRFERSDAEIRAVALLAERRDDSPDGSSGQGAPISDETYNRIPDKFKTPSPNKEDGAKDGKTAPEPQRSAQNDRYRPKSERDADERRRRDDRPNGGGPKPQFPERRAALPNVLLVVSLVAIAFLVYNSFFTSRSTEISWTAFNALLDDDKIESANLRGSVLNGELREIPELADWPEILPDGKKKFAQLIADFDRANPKLAEQYQKELESKKVSVATENRKITLKAENGAVLKEIVVDAEPADYDAIAAEALKNYELGLKIEQRWETNPVAVRGRRGASSLAVDLIQKETKKSAGFRFHQKYTCEAPAFAFSDQAIDARLRAKLDSYTSATPSDNASWMMFLSLAISIFFLVFLFRTMRRANEQMMGGGSGGFGSFAKSLAKRYEPERAKRVTFADAAGMDAVKAELVEIVDYLKNPEKYERMGARVPKGTLLFGPPGTGKTLLARAVAGEANVPFYSINGSEFIQMFVGVGASRVRDIFATAKENAPSILFIDEIDAVGRQRGAGVGGGQDEREQTLNQILSEMDGFNQTDSVMVMASTNRPDVLDPALMRPGRFDRHITVGRPSLKGRVEIFNVYLKKIPFGSDVDVDALAKKTVGFTGADIRNFVNEATLWATRNDKNEVNASDFDFAFEKIQMGLKRDEIISPEEKRKTAAHEAGHALVGWFNPVGSTVHKITIVPRGRSLGATWFLPENDQTNYSETEIKATLARFLAGRAAEKLVYNETSAGAENDLKRGSELARSMIVNWGMSERLGPVAFRNAESHPFLGREMTTDVREYSEETARIIDEEIVRVMREADEVAKNLIVEKRDLFDKLTDALVAEEELEYDRIVEILGPPPKKSSDETPTNEVA